MKTISRNYHFVNKCIVELTVYIFVMMVNFIKFESKFLNDYSENLTKNIFVKLIEGLHKDYPPAWTVRLFQIIKGEHHAEERIFDGGFWKSRYNVGERGVQVTFDEESTIKSFSFKIPGNSIS